MYVYNYVYSTSTCTYVRTYAHLHVGHKWNLLKGPNDVFMTEVLHVGYVEGMAACGFAVLLHLGLVAFSIELQLKELGKGKVERVLRHFRGWSTL